jgi:preprotein translocase subunit SecG
MLHSIMMIVQIVCAAGIVALVLVQRGKGADAGAGFGSGASGTVFGARGASTVLSRATAILAAVFMITSLALTYMGSRATKPADSLLDKLAEESVSTVPAVPAATSAVATPATAAPTIAVPATPTTVPVPTAESTVPTPAPAK